jgi:hypothetical protein
VLVPHRPYAFLISFAKLTALSLSAGVRIIFEIYALLVFVFVAASLNEFVLIETEPAILMVADSVFAPLAKPSIFAPLGIENVPIFTAEAALYPAFWNIYDILLTLLVLQLDKVPMLQLVALYPAPLNIYDMLVTALVFQPDRPRLNVLTLYPAL